jgi:hypothetical protein
MIRLFFFILLISFSARAQLPILPKGVPSPKTNAFEEKGWYRGDSGYLYGVRDTLFTPISGVGVKVYWQSKFWGWRGAKWESEATSESLRDSLLNYVKRTELADTATNLRNAIADAKENIVAGPISSLPAIGDNPGINISPGQFIMAEFYKSQPPTAGLSGGNTYEFKGTGTTVHNLSATIGRQAATTPIASAVITAPSQSYPLSFSQPPVSGSVVVTQSVTTPNNTNTTYTLTVTTQDSKTAQATTTDSWLPKRYRGWVTDTTGIGTPAYSNIIIQNLTNELSSSKSWTFNTGNPTGTQFYVIAYYVSAGALNSLVQNGFPALDAYNSTSRSFTNAASPSFTGTWYFYWSKNGQTLSSDITTN